MSEPAYPVRADRAPSTRTPVDGSPPRVMWFERRMLRNSGGAAPFWRRADDGGVGWQIKQACQGMIHETAVAYPEPEPNSGETADPASLRASGARRIMLWADPARQAPLAEVVTESPARRRTVHYEVRNPQGELLATIARRSGGLPLRRTRWTVHQADHPPAIGRKGHSVAWVLWAVSLPLQPVVFLVTLLALSPMGIVRPPRRMRWRIKREVVLDYRRRRREDELHLVADWWDSRVAAALTALLYSHGGRFSRRWDDESSAAR